MPDVPVYYEELTVNEHLELLAAVYGKNKKGCGQPYRTFELAEYLDKLPDTLSKGTKQKLMIACAVLRKFRFVCCG